MANDERMERWDYEQALQVLQVELCALQDWVIEQGANRVSPRVFRVVALPAPTEREQSQVYMQRYIRQPRAAGEVVIFDRSWYNRAGVEYVHVLGCARRAILDVVAVQALLSMGSRTGAVDDDDAVALRGAVPLRSAGAAGGEGRTFVRPKLQIVTTLFRRV